MSTTSAAEGAGASPRVALFFTDLAVMGEIQAILSEYYSSLLVITDREKLQEFPFPLIIVVDHIHEVAQIKAAHPITGTEIFLVARPEQSEMIGAAYDAGATECLAYPFDAEEVIAKTEKYLSQFRK